MKFIQCKTTLFLILFFQFTSHTFGKNYHTDFWYYKEKINNGSVFELNLNDFKNKLLQAPNASERKPSDIVLFMPTSEGKKISFRFYQNTVIHPNLAKKYPNIKTYVGIGLENPTHRATVVLNGDKIIGSVDSNLKPSHFKSFNVQDRINGIVVYNETIRNEGTFCKTKNSVLETNREFPECMGTDDPCYPAGTELVTYRFAAMVTEAVTNDAADGTIEGGLTWLVGSVAYVNSLYVRDVSFQLQIIENNDELIFTNDNPAPDVFNQDCGDGWATLGCELGVVDSVLDARVGSGGWDSTDEERLWDYGALFDTGYPGGLAYCPGPTSAQVPSMAVFSHEVMHNFGSPHNFCGENGIRTSIGGTIMVHSVNQTGNMFSTHSTEWALNYQETVGPYGNWYYHNGYTTEQMNNIIPEVILPEAGFTIPIETPYVLEGSSYPLSENYTYSWESNDTADELYSADPEAENFLLPDQGSLSIPVAPHPRGYRRYFPEMDLLLNNEYEKYGMNYYTGINQIVEKLPFATREMNMRLVVRTNDPYSGSLNHKNLKFFVDGTAGPFKVTSQTDSTIWEVGSEQTIIWDVANTDNPDGVNCQTVNILISFFGDKNFDFILADSILNNGSYTFIVPPTIPTNSARIMVQANDNIFFDINNGIINIQNNNIPSMSISDELIELSLPIDSLSTISIGITNDGEEASVLSYKTSVAENRELYIDFANGLLPSNWYTATNAECDNPGWFVTQDATSAYFPIPAGNDFYIATNDDLCNSDGSNDMLFTGPIQLPNAYINLSFLRFFTGNYGQEFQVLASLDNWENSIELLSLDIYDGNVEEWLKEKINLDSYAGQTIDIAFRSNDNGNWASGVALDEISLNVIPKWISSNDSGYVHYLETELADISINTNDLGYGLYESKIVVLNNNSSDTDTIDISLTVEDVSVSIGEQITPLVFSLDQNYPNPFNPITRIDYELPKTELVSLKIFDVMGREVVSLINEVQKPGRRFVLWDATNNLGQSVSAGMYIYTIQAGEFRKTKKMVLLK